jgi:hypothetical protein
MISKKKKRNKTKKSKGGNNSPNSPPKKHKFFIKEIIDFLNILKNKSKKAKNPNAEGDILDYLNNLDIDDRTNTYTGASDTTVSMMYLTLIDEYGKDDCIIEEPTILGFRIQYPYNSEINDLEVKSVCYGLLQCLKNSEQKIFIIPFSFNIGSDSHSNILIYRVFDKYHQLDHYEPHGGRVNWYGNSQKDNELNNEIIKTLTTLTSIMSRITKMRVEYVKASDICPINQNGIQSRHQKKSTKKWRGFCTLWSILIAELTLVAPNYTTKQIYECFNEFAYNSTELDYIVKGYLITLDERLLKYGNEFEELRYLEQNVSVKNIVRIEKLKKLWYQNLSIRINARDNLQIEK